MMMRGSKVRIENVVRAQRQSGVFYTTRCLSSNGLECGLGIDRGRERLRKVRPIEEGGEEEENK